jgi:hypothetical protein
MLKFVVLVVMLGELLVLIVANFTGDALSNTTMASLLGALIVASAIYAGEKE